VPLSRYPSDTIRLRNGEERKDHNRKQTLSLAGDTFPKIIVRHDIRKRWYDESAVMNISIIDFLLDKGLLLVILKSLVFEATLQNLPEIKEFVNCYIRWLTTLIVQKWVCSLTRDSIV